MAPHWTPHPFQNRQYDFPHSAFLSTCLSTFSLAFACYSTHSLKLSNTNSLSIPYVCTSFYTRSFSVAAPTIWNSLPSVLGMCTSPDTFHHHLKIYYNPLNTFLLRLKRFSFGWPLCSFTNYIYLHCFLCYYHYRIVELERSTKTGPDRFSNFMSVGPDELVPGPVVMNDDEMWRASGNRWW